MKPLHLSSDIEFDRLAGQAIRLPDAPHRLVRHAVGLWAARPAANGLRAGADRLRRCIVATLSFDSAATSGLALGMRGGADAARQLVCSTPVCDIDLRVAASAGSFHISGQVLGCEPGAELLLVASGPQGLERFATVDALGEFRLADLARGCHRLTLRGPGDDIVLPTIELGA